LLHDTGSEKEAEHFIDLLRETLVVWRDGGSTSRLMLERLNHYLEGHGIEYIRSTKDDQHGAHGAYYVNMGDTYVPTFVLDLDRNRVWATSWGDWVETQERQGKKFD
jgi:hypothetical protein